MITHLAGVIVAPNDGVKFDMTISLGSLIATATFLFSLLVVLVRVTSVIAIFNQRTIAIEAWITEQKTAWVNREFWLNKLHTTVMGLVQSEQDLTASKAEFTKIIGIIEGKLSEFRYQTGRQMERLETIIKERA